MALSARTTRIIAASALSVVLIGGAYALSGPVPFLSSKFANAQSTDELLKAYAAKDSDNDGLPDWQEVLYGTDPNNPHSVSATLTDSEAVAKGLVTPHTSDIAAAQQATTTVGATSADIPGKDPAPGSLTDQFGQEFFQAYIAASNGGQQLTADQQQALITQLMASYSQKASALLQSPYTSISVHVSQTATVSSYAGTIENIFRAHDVPAGTGTPIALMQAFLQNNDTGSQKKLALYAAAYAAMTTDLLQVAVPPALADQHLALVQAIDTLARSTKTAANYQQDPLAVLGSLSLYQPTAQNLTKAIQSIAQVIIATDGEPAPGTPGAMLVSIARSVQ